MTIIKLIELIETNGPIFNIFHLRLSFIQVLDDLKWEKLLLKKTRHTMRNDQMSLLNSLIKENVILCWNYERCWRGVSDADVWNAIRRSSRKEQSRTRKSRKTSCFWNAGMWCTSYASSANTAHSAQTILSKEVCKPHSLTLFVSLANPVRGRNQSLKEVEAIQQRTAFVR